MTETRAAVGGDLTGLDEPVRRLFERIAGPAASAPPDLAAIGAALVELAKDLDYVGRWVEQLGDESGTLRIHAPARGPRLMIVHRREGQMGAIHDHATWVAISPIVGLETHRRWRVVIGDSGEAEAAAAAAAAAERTGATVGAEGSDGTRTAEPVRAAEAVAGPGAARLELVEALALRPADATTLLPPDDLHDHGHLAGQGRPAHVLIMTGDDQTRFRRNEWDLATGRHRILEPGDRGRWLASQPMPDA